MKAVRVAVGISAFLGMTLLLQGCYEEQRVVMMRAEIIPMTQQDVVEMVKEGVPSSQIIREIQASGTVFRLSANDVEYLKGEGVPIEIINVMLDTREAPPAVVERAVVVRDPWWAWDYYYAPGYYYYPWHVGLSFSYVHYGGRRHYYRPGYGIHYRRYR